MGKLLAVAALALALGGCATIRNPVDVPQLAAIESAYGIALSLAVAYRDLPLCRTGTSPGLQNVCAKRSVVVRLQRADRDAQIALAAARSFVRANPTLSAASVLAVAQNAVSALQAIETNEGLR
jgi:ABC-type uncharacterized transport system substrate-binding protein